MDRGDGPTLPDEPSLHVSTMVYRKHNRSTGPLRLYDASLSHDHASSYLSLGEVVPNDPWVLLMWIKGDSRERRLVASSYLPCLGRGL